MITTTMPDLILPRRQFLKAAVGIIAAPAVVRFESLMKLSAPPPMTMIHYAEGHLSDRNLQVIIEMLTASNDILNDMWIYEESDQAETAFEATLPPRRPPRA